MLYFALSDYRYKKDELFKRLKVTTFAQLVSVMVFLLERKGVCAVLREHF
jgi:hypothetical protein